MSRLLIVCLVLLTGSLFANDNISGFTEPGGELTLKNAVAATLLGSPQLHAYSSEIRSARARQLQAGLTADPELEFEFDEFGGNKSFSGLDSMETTLKLSQIIQFGDKVAIREKVYSYDTLLAELEYASKELDICKEVADSFIKLLVVQKKIELAGEQVQICKKMADMIDKRVQAGKTGPLDYMKAKMLLAKAGLVEKQIVVHKEYLRKKLASLWGSQEPQFGRLAGDLEEYNNVPPIAELEKIIANNPDINQWAVEIQKRQAKAELARSQTSPDIKLSGGVKYFNESDGTAFVVGIGIPLRKPVRNRQLELEARHDLETASQQQRSNYLLVWGELNRLHSELASSYEKVTVIKSEILSTAKELFEATMLSYEQGKVDYLYLLDSQRSYFSVQEEYLDALAEYHLKMNELDRIAGN